MSAEPAGELRKAGGVCGGGQGVYALKGFAHPAKAMQSDPEGTADPTKTNTDCAPGPEILNFGINNCKNSL